MKTVNIKETETRNSGISIPGLMLMLAVLCALSGCDKASESADISVENSFDDEAAYGFKDDTDSSDGENIDIMSTGDVSENTAENTGDGENNNDGQNTANNANVSNDQNADNTDESGNTSDTTDDTSADTGNKVPDKIVTPASGADRSANANKRIVCWGDSLTEGTGGNGVTLPSTIADLSGANVLNYGVYAEASTCIMARQGSNQQYTVESITIPAECTPVRLNVSGDYGWEMLLVFGNAGINNVFLSGIEGRYDMDAEGNRLFTRLTPGEAVFVPEGTPLITHAMTDKRPDDIAVIWAGSNDDPKTDADINALIGRIDTMINYHGNDKYIVVSLTARHDFINRVLDVNNAFARHYGSHYVDIRTFLVNDSLSYLGITPTDKDREALARDDVPYSIRMSMSEDENHGNADFYRIAGELVYKRMRELSYLK